jgi:hypothetical protein
MHPEEGFGARYVAGANFVSPCEAAPILSSAQAWGPTTGQATATAPPGIKFTKVHHLSRRPYSALCVGTSS